MKKEGGSFVDAFGAESFSRKNVELRLNLKLPRELEGKIVINPARIMKICRMAGIENLLIKSGMGDTSTGSPTIDGIQADGTALAGKRGDQIKVRTWFAEVTDDEDPLFDHPLRGSTRWTNVTIGINQSEIHQRVMRDETVPYAYDPKVWADYLDAGLKLALFSASFSHDFKNVPPSNYYPLAVNALLQLHQELAGSSVLAHVIYGGFAGLFISALYGIGANNKAIANSLEPKPIRYSVFTAPQLDHLIGVLAYGSQVKLVKAVK